MFFAITSHSRVCHNYFLIIQCVKFFGWMFINTQKALNKYRHKIYVIIFSFLDLSRLRSELRNLLIACEVVLSRIRLPAAPFSAWIAQFSSLTIREFPRQISAHLACLHCSPARCSSALRTKAALRCLPRAFKLKGSNFNYHRCSTNVLQLIRRSD